MSIKAYPILINSASSFHPTTRLQNVSSDKKIMKKVPQFPFLAGLGQTIPAQLKAEIGAFFYYGITIKAQSLCTTSADSAFYRHLAKLNSAASKTERFRMESLQSMYYRVFTCTIQRCRRQCSTSAVRVLL